MRKIQPRNVSSDNKNGTNDSVLSSVREDYYLNGNSLKVTSDEEKTGIKEEASRK